MTYAIIVLSVLVGILLIRSFSHDSQLKEFLKLNVKTDRKIYCCIENQNKSFIQILERMSSDRRNLHSHVESMREKINDLKGITKEADNQLLNVLMDLASKSGYEVYIKETDYQPEVHASESLSLRKTEELEVKPKKTVTYRKK